MNTFHLNLSLLATAALAFPATSQALEVPADTVTYDAVAAAHWGAEPCGGQVDVRWDHLGPATNAHAAWLGVPGDATTYTDCSITYSLDVAWDPAKLCTIDEHEHGHLMGHDHDDGVLMNAYYVGPTAECLQPQTAASQAPVAVKPHHMKRWRGLARRWRRHSDRSLELGVQDDGNPATVLDAGHDASATWVRMIFRVGDPNAPGRIRAAHAQGFKVLLTIGGSGTKTRRPSRRSILRYLRTLPMAEKYTVINEPDLAGVKPCVYLKTWKASRRVLGHKLLFGDFSPHRPLSYTAAVRNCKQGMPAHLQFALHPYQRTDPLESGADEGSIGNLAYARKFLKTACGVAVDWWLTEFGYLYDGPYAVTDEQAAAMWPRAKLAASRAHARMLGVYMAQGPSWDSRPRELAWSSLTGRLPASHLVRSADPIPFDVSY